jgi:hypothetical protein
MFLIVAGVVGLAINFAVARQDTAPTRAGRTQSGTELNKEAITTEKPQPKAQSDTQIQQADLADVHRVATNFAEAFSSYHWEDDQEEIVMKVSEWVTPKLGEELRNNSGASFLYAERKRLHESATAKTEHIQTVGSSASSAELITVLLITTNNDEGTNTDRSTITLRMAFQEGRWLVSEIA